MNSNLKNYIEINKENFVQIREHIHAHPELSFQEYKTSKYIQNLLKENKIDFKVVADTGLVAIIEGKNPSKHCLALRSDLDALPILELNDVPYKSKNDGIMHACGHDVHSSILLATAIVLNANKDHWEGTVKFIFQPGEEKHPGGASLMLMENVLDNPKVDAICALHVYPHLPVGKLGYKVGKYMASADEVYITIKGKGGHAALPHQTIDPIVIASEVILGIQQLISRKNNPFNPSVFTIGKIEGGVAPNVIPDEVKLAGTLRCMDESWRFKAHDLIKNYVAHVAKASGAEADIEVLVGYPCLINHDNLTVHAVDILSRYFGNENLVELDLRMAAEDFSFYTHHVPGCFYRIGTNTTNEKNIAPVHNPYFDIDANAIEIGILAMCELASNFDKSKLL